MKSTTQNAPRFVTDAKGNQVGVLLTLKAYRRLLVAEEELADVRAYDAARPRVMAEVAAGACLTLQEFQARRRRK